jgi:D-serine deaminase-like pyridoxal phosphate-dependent protein
MPITLDQLETPALLLDAARLEANLRRMATRASGLGTPLRPHLKTHKSAEVARRQSEHGCRGVTVATLEEARFFAAAGHDDLTWAFPVIVGRIPEAADLASRVRLGMVVDSEEAIEALERAGGPGRPWETWIKVDCGYHRAGVEPKSSLALRLGRRLAASAAFRFRGLLTHSGHAYQARTTEALAAAARDERNAVLALAARLWAEGIEVPELSVGSTPALAVDSGPYEGITEIRPGNYVFNDHTQVVLGACSPLDCAVTVLAGVVSSSRERDRTVVDAGALALSKDLGPAWAPRPTMGEVFEDYDAGLLSERYHLLSVSQEHGILAGWLPVGHRVRILPNHSCLTVACFDEYTVVEGDRVVDRWPIHRRR